MKVQGKHNNKIKKNQKGNGLEQQRNRKMCETVNPFWCVSV